MNAADVRNHVFKHAASTGRVPQPPQIAAALSVPEEEVRAALVELANGKVLILAPNSTNIWAANPFCAVPSGFRVLAKGKKYWGICIWDALGVVAAIGADEAVVEAPCGDCYEPMQLSIRDGKVTHSEGMIHFAVPTLKWWENIGFA